MTVFKFQLQKCREALTPYTSPIGASVIDDKLNLLDETTKTNYTTATNRAELVSSALDDLTALYELWKELESWLCNINKMQESIKEVYSDQVSQAKQQQQEFLNDIENHKPQLEDLAHQVNELAANCPANQSSDILASLAVLQNDVGSAQEMVGARIELCASWAAMSADMEELVQQLRAIQQVMFLLLSAGFPPGFYIYQLFRYLKIIVIRRSRLLARHRA